MVAAELVEVEAELRRLWDRGDNRAVAELAIGRYGAEVYGFLVATMRNDDDAAEAFSQAGLDLCAGIASFAWRCPLRAWLYVLARHASARLRRSRARRRTVPLSQVSDIIARERSQTAAYRRTEPHDALRQFRDSLEPDDRALLVLRLDRNLPWSDIARVMSADSADADQLKREAARLRKRFQVLKERVRASVRHADSDREGR